MMSAAVPDQTSGAVMTRTLAGAGMALLVTALLAQGCGSGSNEGTDSGAKQEADSAKTTCKAPATSRKTGLPAAFPIPGEMTVTQVRKDGPTIVVDGYWTAGVDEAYSEYKDQVGQAGYKVLFTENEHHDAEISYRGSRRTGQIALRGDCTEADTSRVHITNRPA
jgi:hypothetical protein